MNTTITITDRGGSGLPPLVNLDAGGADVASEWSDSALVARVMLQAAAYLFAQGQAVEFGPEVPRGVLK
jgi:hypothetical protein